MLARFDGPEMDATLSELMALIPRPTQGSPAARGNPGLDDAIPFGIEASGAANRGQESARRIAPARGCPLR